ncbi:MAG: hypothetical protein WEA36_04085 [Balneolaceae bacterium]
MNIEKSRRSNLYGSSLFLIFGHTVEGDTPASPPPARKFRDINIDPALVFCSTNRTVCFD